MREVLKISPGDSVAVALVPLKAGDTVIVVAPRERHIAELRQIFAERG